MEKSSDRYLHKKFKKQLSTEPNSQNVDKDEEKIYTNLPGIRQNIDSIVDNAIKSSDDNPVRNSNDSVPKLSTNENAFNVTVQQSFSNIAKSSISHVNVVNDTSESNLNFIIEDLNERNCTHAGELVNPQSSSNSCISYVISKHRLENLTPTESHFRAANFDTTTFSILEPIAIPAADTSSILEQNVYSKKYVTSKLVNVERAGDISSNSSLGNDHHQDDSCSLSDNKNELKYDGHTHELVATEKSTGGKYICSYCNLACSKPSVLQKHIRAHTNERPYPCVSCGFSFKTRSNLYKHCRSRTHANRVMGNKVQDLNNEGDTDSQNKMEYIEQNNSMESGGEDTTTTKVIEEKGAIVTQDVKTKPYKPRFHTHKAFYDDLPKENNQKEIIEDQKVPDTGQNRPSNSDLLSLHINDVISKNNAIINSNESYLIRKRSVDNSLVDSVNNNNNEPPLRHPHEIVCPPNSDIIADDRHNDEPLNLTNKSRKRCVSEVAEPMMHTSLIKELLLKNLYADSMQCPHCKMIFQTVTELELHKLRSCKGYTRTGARYSRSSSVNVASVLTKHKNCFVDIPHLHNTVFPLKSPGPFLGKTRLVGSDKSKSFSFDDGLPNFQHSTSDILKTSLRYSISPLTIQNDKFKKTPVKLFGGEVKITHTSGETKSFKIDGKDNGEQFVEYGGRVSENRVVKSSLQSGGTVLQNKSTYNSKQDTLRSSPDVISVYDNTSLSPSIDIMNFEKAKFNFDRQQNHELGTTSKSSSDLLARPPTDAVGNTNFISSVSPSYKYTNIMDFSQKAVKLLAPNLKQPNLSIPGVPMPNIIVLPRSPSLSFDIKRNDSPQAFDSSPRTHVESVPVNVNNFPKSYEPELRHSENIHFAQKQILLQQKMAVDSPNLCNPVNLLVNGKVVRYVPGIPGPVAADVNLDNTPYRYRSQKPNMRISTLECATKSSMAMEIDSPIEKSSELRSLHYNQQHQGRKVSGFDLTSKTSKYEGLEIKTNMEMVPPKVTELRSPNIKSPSLNDIKSSNHSTASNSNEASRKFARPNTLALKPSLTTQKQHHGLTPTMFNQILISPDTPRVAKKYMQHFLHGNYFSYLGLKSSTKSVYCTLNKTQPSYVPHFKKLSMYSEWRQQDIKGDKLYVSSYDSRQRQHKYVTAGKATADLVVHSSYKFIVTDASSTKGEENQKSSSILGGYESNEDYTYVRGRGRGRYVCDQCGIRCKKPSMLKKHIRTHTNDRPFTCSHCNFSFKTKGNLTKHMKSKAHTKNYAASSSSSSSSTHQSGTQSSDSDTDDSGMDSSDESTRQQEHEAAYGLLSLSQKTNQSVTSNSPPEMNSIESPVSFMNNEQVTQVNNTNFAKNKILDQQVTINFNTSNILNNETPTSDLTSKETQNFLQFLGKTNTNRPLTYPYTSDMMDDQNKSESSTLSPSTVNSDNYDSNQISDYKVEQQVNTMQKHQSIAQSLKMLENRKIIPITITYDPSYLNSEKSDKDAAVFSPIVKQTPMVKINDRIVLNNVPYNSIMPSEVRKRKVCDIEGPSTTKLHRINTELEAMDLSMPSLEESMSHLETTVQRYNGTSAAKENELQINVLRVVDTKTLPHADTVVRNLEYNNLVEKINFSNTTSNIIADRFQLYKVNDDSYKRNGVAYDVEEYSRENQSRISVKNSSPLHGENEHLNINYAIQENSPPTIITTFTEVPNSFSPMDYDNSAMETLADVATKQVKLERNTLAKSVASEYLKLATKLESHNNDCSRETNNFSSATTEVNEMIVKSEENKSCTICAKNFNKPSQLRLHMNIHYLERPFRCDPCSVSFRTKGHLQKHERSASHHNKLSSSPLLSSSEPRPFKCSDCNVAFRIHGHLAKHLRSKMHIMKLECLAKIPFGLYAELERANSLLTEINTTDGDQCLESLKALARKVFINDPSKLNQLEVSFHSADSTDS